MEPTTIKDIFFGLSEGKNGAYLYFFFLLNAGTAAFLRDANLSYLNKNQAIFLSGRHFISHMYTTLLQK